MKDQTGMENSILMIDDDKILRTNLAIEPRKSMGYDVIGTDDVYYLNTKPYYSKWSIITTRKGIDEVETVFGIRRGEHYAGYLQKPFTLKELYAALDVNTIERLSADGDRPICFGHFSAKDPICRGCSSKNSCKGVKEHGTKIAITFKNAEFNDMYHHQMILANLNPIDISRKKRRTVCFEERRHC